MQLWNPIRGTLGTECGVLVLELACWNITQGGQTRMRKRKAKKEEKENRNHERWRGESEGTECFRCYGNRPLLLLLAEETEAFLFVFLLVFLPLARAGLGRQGDCCRERLGAAGGRSALVAWGDF